MSLLSMPPELIVQVFGLLPSLSDVVALAAVCSRLRNVWIENVSLIYHQVAPRILYESHARQFLADQGGPTVGSDTLSAEDVRRMIRNAKVVDKAITQFEREVVPKVKTGGLPSAQFYGKGQRHPPHLTRTERRRFVRAYYQLWGMMKLDATESRKRLELMTLKQLYHLCEMCRLTQSIGREELLPAPASTKDPNMVDHRCGRSTERRVLHSRAWEHLEQTYMRIHNEDTEAPELYAKYEGYLWWVVIWDHWQPSLQQLVRCSRGNDLNELTAFEKKYVWDESSDEDACI